MRMSPNFSNIFNPTEEVILYYLEFFAIDDAILLAELYNDTARSSDSLYLLAHCFLRGGQKENAYKLLSLNELITPQLRFIFAKCCYDLNKLQEAENVLRMDRSAQLHSIFQGTVVEPFAHALLARIFSESGRIDEALKENRYGLEVNLLSWSAIKTHCELGATDLEKIYPKLNASISSAKNYLKDKTNRVISEDKPVKANIGPIVKELDDKSATFAPKKQRSTLNKKELTVSRRRMDNSIEIRRSTRLFASSQDSENMSAVNIRSSSRTRTGILTGTAVRNSQDKQLRSMNRINEIHVNRNIICVPSSQPPIIDKFTESNDDLSDASMNLKPIVSKKNCSGSQAVAPLSSHNQNAQEKEQRGVGVIKSISSFSTNPTRPRVQRNPRLIQKPRKSLSPQARNIVPSTLSSIVNDIAYWTPVFANIAESIYHLAQVQSALSHYKIHLALERLTQMPETCSKSALAKELAARVYLEKLDYQKTKEILEEVHRDYPHRTSGMEILSTALWHTQDSYRLSTLASELTQSARYNAETWCVAGNCFSVQKLHDIAIECFERAILLNPHFAYAFSLLGHELLDTDQLDKAASSFRRALLLCPTDYRAWFGLGLMHFKREQLSLSRIHLNRAVSINPHNSVLLCQLSVVEQALHNNDKAMELLERALFISPENVACRFYKARLLYEMHEYEKCREELNDVKLFAHDEAQIFFLLGRVHKKLGNTHLALINFSWAAEMDPRGEQSHHNINEDPYDDEPTQSMTE